MLDIGMEGNQQLIPYWGGRGEGVKRFCIWSCYLRNTKMSNYRLSVCCVSIKQLNENKYKFHLFFTISFMGRKTFSNYYFFVCLNWGITYRYYF